MRNGLIFTLLCGILVIMAGAALAFDNWNDRTPPAPPANQREQLALQAAQEAKTVRQERLTARYEGMQNAFSIVSVELAPEAREDFHEIIRYRIRDNAIWSDTATAYVGRPNPESEIIAAEIAKDVVYRGIRHTIPIFFNGRVFAVEFDGKCAVTVRESDETSVYFTYHYYLCK